MLSRVQLLQFIEECQKLPLIFSDSFNEKEIYWMKLETEVGFDFFKKLVQQVDFDSEQEAIEQLIRRYLLKRGELVGEKSSIAYLNHPFLPINQLCLKVAEAIAKPDEAVLTMLMPSVWQFCRPMGFSLKEETEEEGHLPLELYALSQRKTKPQLIPVAEIFNQAKVNTNVLFPDFQKDLTALQYKLGGRDFLTLEQIGGEASRVYMHALKQKHNQQFDDQSIGFAIRKLARDLKRGAVGDAGTEHIADNEVLAGPIQTFYGLWRALPEETKAQVAHLKLKHYGYKNATLECYFLTLFARCLGCELTDEESLRQKNEDIFPCVDQISQALDEYLIQHPQLFTISLNEQTTATSTPSDLQGLCNAALQALNTRGQSLGFDDDNWWYKLAQLMTVAEYPILRTSQIITPELCEMRDLLSLIPINLQLFAAVLNCLGTRLSQLPFKVHKLHKVLPHFLAEKQEIIIQANSSEIVELIRDEPQQYNFIFYALKSELRQRFEQDYFKLMCDGVKYGDECISLMVNYNETQLTVMLSYLQPRLQELFKGFDFSRLFTHGVKGHPNLLIDAFFEQLSQWFSPLTYSTWRHAWGNESKKYFLGRYVESIKTITGFDALLKFLQHWENKVLMHETILEHVKPQLKMWVTDSQHLGILLESINCKSDAFVEFSDLIADRALLHRWLIVLPSAARLRALSTVNYRAFIHSFSDLHDLFFSLEREERQVVTAQLSGHLSCTFTELSGLISDKTSTFINDLERYAAQCTNSSRLQAIEKLMEKFRNPQTSLEEFLDLIRREKKKIEEESFSFRFFFSSAPGSRLFTLLKKFEGELKELARFVNAVTEGNSHKCSPSN
ncbi:hypothetical protein [Legionella saoudiensis]|uniref:hypothetical protein n=1 Tax=Legionella saoudiensis TaxID=1750561 RepID=UPI0007316133|nr:hypothetical protein [Legionella saoudiensis]